MKRYVMIEIDEGSSCEYGMGNKGMKIFSEKDGQERVLHITGLEGRDVEFINVRNKKNPFKEIGSEK